MAPTEYKPPEHFEKSSFPIVFDVPAGSQIVVNGPDGNVLLTYTTQVDIPAGSRIAIKVNS